MWKVLTWLVTAAVAMIITGFAGRNNISNINFTPSAYESRIFRQWSMASKPIGNEKSAIISSAIVAKPTLTPEVPGSYVHGLLVNDGSVNTLPETIKIATSFQPTNIVIIGNSIAMHGPSPSIGWYGSWGMAASSADMDFAHVVATSLNLPLTVVASRGLELNPTASDAEIQKAAAPVKTTTLAIIELGDNIELSKLSLSSVQYGKVLDAVKHARTLICTSTWWKDEAKDKMIRSACTAHGGSYVFIGDIYTDPTNKDKLDVPYGNDGVNIHPHDWGMARIAERIVSATH